MAPRSAARALTVVVVSLLGSASVASAQTLAGSPIEDPAVDAPVVDAPPPPPSARTDHRFALRGDAAMVFDGVFGAGNFSLGVTGAWSLDRQLSLEGTVAYGGDAFGEGVTTMALGRFAIPLDHAGVHAITFAAGPSASFLSHYGTVWMARGEIAYELRTHGGFSLLIGGGPALVLADSRLATRSCGGWVCLEGEQAQFKAGDVPVQARVAAGWAF